MGAHRASLTCADNLCAGAAAAVHHRRLPVTSFRNRTTALASHCAEGQELNLGAAAPKALRGLAPIGAYLVQVHVPVTSEA